MYVNCTKLRRVRRINLKELNDGGLAMHKSSYCERENERSIKKIEKLEPKIVEQLIRGREREKG